MSLFEIESPRAQTYIELADCAIRSTIVDNILMKFANVSLFLETERIDDTMYYVVSARETVNSGSKMLAYSFTPSKEELGMDLREFIGDFLSEEVDADDDDLEEEW